MPWRRMMAVGLGLLRLAPRDFWAMSLPELQAVLAGVYGLDPAGAPLARADLDALMRHYPDQPPDPSPAPSRD